MIARIERPGFRRAALAILLTISLAPLAARGDESVRMRRFALMAGFNDGGPTRPKLHYAVSDAQALTRVLETLGGVLPDDALLVQDTNRAAFLAAFDRLSQMVAAGRTPAVRREVVVYYSGHSDEEGLLIGGERVSYDELRQRIQSIPAEVRLAILDSCASGAFTRPKGGQRRAPFLMDAAANTKGHAFLTSSAINEVAQESNRIGASFFTHYLISGLRGAADVNRDRRVTLQEAYQFASAETLARTEKTRGGPQHAAYEFDLVGTSDLVVTDVRTTQATLGLGADLAGRIGVRDDQGNLVVELRKAGGASIELGLEAGTYRVSMEGGPTIFEAEVTLPLGQHAALGLSSFHPGPPLEAAVARGDEPASAAAQPVATVAAPLAVPVLPPLRSTWIHLGLFPMSGDGEWDVRGLSFGFVADRVGQLSAGLQLSLAANLIDRGMAGAQLTVGTNILRGPGRGAQLSVGANYATDLWKGVQSSVGMNYVGTWLAGVQMTVGANLVREDVHGAQLAVGMNYAGGRLRGAQFAVGANLAREDSRGLQVVAGANVAPQAFQGAQLAAGGNYAGKLGGAQVAPVNLARSARGLQLGVINAAGEIAGGQVGVVNLAMRGRGFDVGVLNVAREHDGETFGLLNLIGNGVHSVAAYATDSMLGNLELKLGSRHLYTGFQLAYQPGDGIATGPERFGYGSRRYGWGFGLGWRQPLAFARFRYLEIEASSLNVRSGFSANAYGFSSDGDHPMLASLRALVGIEIGSGVNAIVGMSGNVAIAWGGRDLDLAPDFLQAVQRSGQTTVREYPGLVLGLQF
jgi:hypothetical protein